MKYMYLMLICLSQLLHTFLAHIHDYRTYICYLAPCDTGQQILILITWKLPWEEKMKICVEEYYYMYYILCFGVLFLSVCVYYLKYWYLSLEPNFLWSLWAASSTTDSNTVMNAVILLYWSPGQVSKHSICSVSNCDNIHGKMSLEN